MSKALILYLDQNDSSELDELQVISRFPSMLKSEEGRNKSHLALQLIACAQSGEHGSFLGALIFFGAFLLLQNLYSVP